MSIVTCSTRKSNHFLNGEDCQEDTIKSLKDLQHSSGVNDSSMLRRASVGGREISHCDGMPSTMGTSSDWNKAQTAMREVGSLRSSNEASVMRVEQRQGRSANVSEVEGERSDGSRDLATEAVSYHYRNSTKVFSDMEHYARERMRRWLWKKHSKKHGLYTRHYNNERLHQHYGLIKLPLNAAWKYS